MAAVPRHEEIEALLERHGPMMAYVVRGILSDPHEQEECLAQVRARVWERWESYDRERSSPATWHSAVGRILWGLALCTFRLEVFYLQYLLPLLGATLLYLGYRSLRRENRWFHLGWIMAGIHLAVQMTVLVLGGTPVLDRIGAIPWLNWSLTWALQAVNLLMLLSLRQGSRTAFALLGGGEGDETPPRDWLGRGLVAYVIAIAVALWCELDRCAGARHAGRDHHQRPGLLWPEHRLYHSGTLSIVVHRPGAGCAVRPGLCHRSRAGAVVWPDGAGSGAGRHRCGHNTRPVAALSLPEHPGPGRYAGRAE